jgi:hypothetical protein
VSGAHPEPISDYGQINSSDACCQAETSNLRSIRHVQAPADR